MSPSNDDEQMVEFIKQKYNDLMKPPSVEISKPIVDGQEHYVNIELSVIDNGVGMSEEGCKKLFIDFSKLDENS